MKDVKLLSKEEALEIARSHKGNPNSSMGLFYALLQGATPEIRDMFEDQMAVMIQSGTAIGNHMAGLEPGTPAYNEMVKFLHDANAAARRPRQQGDSDG
jgi:hypothetical protein